MDKFLADALLLSAMFSAETARKGSWLVGVIISVRFVVIVVSVTRGDATQGSKLVRTQRERDVRRYAACNKNKECEEAWKE